MRQAYSIAVSKSKEIKKRIRTEETKVHVYDHFTCLGPTAQSVEAQES